MQRILRSFVLLLLVGTVAVPALADVTVTAVISKDKDVSVIETITKIKSVDLTAAVSLSTDAAAQAQAVVNVGNKASGVNVGERQFDCPPGGPCTEISRTPSTLRREAKLLNAIQGNAGVIGVNQDAGALANQGNVVSLGMIDNPNAFANTQAEVSQANRDSRSNQLVVSGETGGDPLTTITNSITDNTGIVGVNQNTGNLNSQTNAVAMVVGLGGQQVALSEAALGQANSGNFVSDSGVVNANTITNVANNNVAIVGVNQASGSLNNQAAVVSFAAITSTVAVSTP
jgi:hypothetical protein